MWRTPSNICELASRIIIKARDVISSYSPRSPTLKTVRFLSEPCLVFDQRDSLEGDATASYDSTVWSKGLGCAVRTTRGPSSNPRSACDGGPTPGRGDPAQGSQSYSRVCLS